MSCWTLLLSIALASSLPTPDPAPETPDPLPVEGWTAPGGAVVKVDCRRRSLAQDLWVAEQGASECRELLLETGGPFPTRPEGVQLLIDDPSPEPELVRWAGENDVVIRLPCDRPLPEGIQAVECVERVDDWTHIEKAGSTLRRLAVIVPPGPGLDLPRLTDLLVLGRPRTAIPRTVKHLQIQGSLAGDDYAKLAGLDLVSLSIERRFRDNHPADFFDVIGDMQSLERLEFIGRVSDTDLASLVDLPALEEIRLRLTEVTDHGMGHLARIRSLRSVHVGQTEVGDAGVAQLATLPNLEALKVGERVTDAGIAHLAQAKRLRWLDLQQTHILGPGLDALADLPLRYLNVMAVYLKSEPLVQAVGQLRELRMLVLTAGFLTKEEVKTLTRLTRLRGVQIDGGLPLAAYSSFPELRRLYLYHGSYHPPREPSSIAGLHELRYLSLGMRVDDAVLEALNIPASLQGLRLYMPALTNQSVDAISRLRGLRVLEIKGSAGGADCLGRRGDCIPSIRTAIDASGLGRLRLPELRVVRLDYVPLDDATAASWLKLPHLHELWVQHSLLTDSTYRRALNAPALRLLRLRGTMPSTFGGNLTKDARDQACRAAVEWRCL